MAHDLFQFVPQGSDGAQEAENSRIAAIADELQRLCAIHEAQLGTGQANVTSLEAELRAAEQLAKSQGFWMPMSEVFNLGVPGPSGNENDTFVAEKVVYKVNNLFNSGSIVGLLRKNVQPVIAQPRVANAQPATQIMIDTYMAALGFEKSATEGRFTNKTYEVWDLVPRNVLADSEGDIYVVDAEIKQV